jgi:hypothetical protein
VNAKGQHGSTALMIAANCGHLEICHLLIDKGADVNHKYKCSGFQFSVGTSRTAFNFAWVGGPCRLLIWNHAVSSRRLIFIPCYIYWRFCRLFYCFFISCTPLYPIVDDQI